MKLQRALLPSKCFKLESVPQLLILLFFSHFDSQLNLSRSLGVCQLGYYQKKLAKKNPTHYFNVKKWAWQLINISLKIMLTYGKIEDYKCLLLLLFHYYEHLFASVFLLRQNLITLVHLHEQVCVNQHLHISHLF